ncbi:MAG: 2-oxo acid dehydrogenase subunit E2 [Deltaproteobacteria bacterium]|nr:2-oxo acid dehydrogenase subunit E2 [Deltaproteobacteria bacterium]MBK8240955.1 2-oxo acid dehydrogenase subunit E2 [Deltaproteobacteria bacterium]MBP7285713.1 2-oxo acid dehydrogenase subunit E2 [Nannocystaceae bacterium]
MPEFKLPAIGEGVVEGEIVRWLKKPGEAVAANEPLVEVMTDKATVEIPSPTDAVLERIVSDEGVIAPVGSVIAILGSAATSAAAGGSNGARPPAPPASASGSIHVGGPAPVDEARGKVLATPAARALARESGIDLSSIAGDRGRITKAHVELARGSYEGRAVEPAAARSEPPRSEPPRSEPERIEARPSSMPTQVPAAVAAPAPVARAMRGGEPQPDESMPFRGMRRRIADGLVKSYTTAVHYTYVEQIDVTKLVAVREQAKKAAAAEGVQLSYLPFIVKAVLRALRKYPIVNAELDEPGGRIVLKKRYSIGIATATDQGLMVPVVHDADRLSLLDIASEIARVSEAARTGKASREELTGSTFTITSLGAIGGVLATPILNYPEVGILGVHAIRKVPVVDDDDNIRVGHMMNLSVSLDHRVVDGFEGANFLQEVRRYLEDPTLLLLSGI